MQLRKLEYVRLVVVHGSFEAAARAAGTSQPAVTQAIQSLEKELGTTLFERVGRKKLPNKLALSIAQRTTEMLDLIAVVRSNSSHESGAYPHDAALPRLRVGISAAAGLLYGPALEQAWRMREPDGVLHILNAGAPEMLAALAGNELDLVVAPRPRRYEAAGIHRLPLYTSRPAVYCRQGHPLRDARSLADISSAAWAVTGHAGAPGNVIEEAHKVRGLKRPRVLMHCSDYTMLLHMVARTDMLCVIPHPALLDCISAQAVQALHISEGLPQYEVSAFWRRQDDARQDKRHVASIVDALVQARPSDSL